MNSAFRICNVHLRDETVRPEEFIVLRNGRWQHEEQYWNCKDNFGLPQRQECSHERLRWGIMDFYIVGRELVSGGRYRKTGGCEG